MTAKLVLVDLSIPVFYYENSIEKWTQLAVRSCGSTQIHFTAHLVNGPLEPALTSLPGMGLQRTSVLDALGEAARKTAS